MRSYSFWMMRFHNSSAKKLIAKVIRNAIVATFAWWNNISKKFVRVIHPKLRAKITDVHIQKLIRRHPMPNGVAFAENLKALRLASRKTQVKVADAIGVCINYYNLLEHEKCLTLGISFLTHFLLYIFQELGSVSSIFDSFIG